MHIINAQAQKPSPEGKAAQALPYRIEPDFGHII